jgi:hypothetical protein
MWMVEVLYIVGMGRSGSTVLDRILGQQPGYVSLGEADNTWRNGVFAGRTCACHEQFENCSFWQRVVDAHPDAFSVDAAEEVVRLHDRYLDNSHLWRVLTAKGRRDLVEALPPSYLRTLSQLYHGAASVAGATTIVDSSKSPVYAFFLSQAPGIDIRLLHLVRDPRGVVNSWTRQRVELGTSPVSYQHRYPPLKGAALWSLCNAAAHRVSRAIPGDHIFFRYEDFVHRPESALTELLPGGTDPAFGPWAPDRLVDLQPNHSMSGNPMRFARGPTKLALDDGWRDELASSQRRMVELLTFPLSKHYGYLR